MAIMMSMITSGKKMARTGGTDDGRAGEFDSLPLVRVKYYLSTPPLKQPSSLGLGTPRTSE